MALLELELQELLWLLELLWLEVELVEVLELLELRWLELEQVEVGLLELLELLWPELVEEPISELLLPCMLNEQKTLATREVYIHIYIYITYHEMPRCSMKKKVKHTLETRDIYIYTHIVLHDAQ